MGQLIVGRVIYVSTYVAMSRACRERNKCIIESTRDAFSKYIRIARYSVFPFDFPNLAFLSILLHLHHV